MSIWDSSLELAAIDGDLETIISSSQVETSHYIYHNTMQIAAYHGYKDIVEWFYNNRYEYVKNADVIAAAMRINRLDLLKLALSYTDIDTNNGKHAGNALYDATKEGYIDIVKYVFNTCSLKFSSEENNKLSYTTIVKWVLQYASSHTHITQFLLQKGLRNFCKLYISLRKNRILYNLQKSTKKYIHIAILSKPAYFLGSTVPGILYEQDAGSILFS